MNVWDRFIDQSKRLINDFNMLMWQAYRQPIGLMTAENGDYYMPTEVIWDLINSYITVIGIKLVNHFFKNIGIDFKVPFPELSVHQYELSDYKDADGIGEFLMELSSGSVYGSGLENVIDACACGDEYVVNTNIAAYGIDRKEWLRFWVDEEELKKIFKETDMRSLSQLSEKEVTAMKDRYTVAVKECGKIYANIVDIGLFHEGAVTEDGCCGSMEQAEEQAEDVFDLLQRQFFHTPVCLLPEIIWAWADVYAECYEERTNICIIEQLDMTRFMSSSVPPDVKDVVYELFVTCPDYWNYCGLHHRYAGGPVILHIYSKSRGSFDCCADYEEDMCDLTFVAATAIMRGACLIQEREEEKYGRLDRSAV